MAWADEAPQQTQSLTSTRSIPRDLGNEFEREVKVDAGGVKGTSGIVGVTHH